MAKTGGKRKPTPTDKTASRPASKDKPAARIAQIDADLLRLIEQRAELVLESAAAGDDGGQDAGGGCGDDLVARFVEESSGPLPRQALRAIFRELASGCRALVRHRRVAFLGPLYSYSHLAAVQRFGQSVELVPVGTIAAVFEEVNRRQSDFGLVPWENSTDGRIADTLDMFTRLPVRICGEVEMRIQHTLLGKCPRTEVREVYSRPQALSQCRNWLARHLPSARTIEVTSTTTAAQLAGEKPGAAAIASHQAAMEYGLNVLAENIEDIPGNTTRFALIAAGDQVPECTGHDRTALLFQLEHRPGTLAEAMNIFKRNQVNLTWIESFPVPGAKGTYFFFVEIEGHQSDTRVRRAVATLEKRTQRMEVLGSFPSSQAAREALAF